MQYFLRSWTKIVPRGSIPKIFALEKKNNTQFNKTFVCVVSSIIIWDQDWLVYKGEVIKRARKNCFAKLRVPNRLKFVSLLVLILFDRWRECFSNIFRLVLSGFLLNLVWVRRRDIKRNWCGIVYFCLKNQTMARIQASRFLHKRDLFNLLYFRKYTLRLDWQKIYISQKLF